MLYNWLSTRDDKLSFQKSYSAKSMKYKGCRSKLQLVFQIKHPLNTILSVLYCIWGRRLPSKQFIFTKKSPRKVIATEKLRQGAIYTWHLQNFQILSSPPPSCLQFHATPLLYLLVAPSLCRCHMYMPPKAKYEYDVIGLVRFLKIRFWFPGRFVSNWAKEPIPVTI